MNEKEIPLVFIPNPSAYHSAKVFAHLDWQEVANIADAVAKKLHGMTAQELAQQVLTIINAGAERAETLDAYSNMSMALEQIEALCKTHVENENRSH